MPSFALTIALALISSTALALPSPFSHLVPRNIHFQPSQVVLDFIKALTCTTEQRAVIEGTLKDATTLAAVGRHMKIWSPAYRAFFDGKATRSEAEVKYATQRQLVMFNTVKERFDRAYNLLTNPNTPAIPILCDPAMSGELSQLPSERVVCPRGVVAKTENYNSFSVIIICKPFFERVRAKGALSTIAIDYDGKKINMCENPTKLQSATNSAKVLFHEIMHLHQIAPMFDKYNQNDIIDCVYGAYLNGFIARYSTRATLANADSYAYAALSHYLIIRCKDPKTIYHQAEPENPRRHSPERMPMGGTQHYNTCMLPDDAPDINLNNPFRADLSSLGIPDAGKFKLPSEPLGLFPPSGSSTKEPASKGGFFSDQPVVKDGRVGV